MSAFSIFRIRRAARGIGGRGHEDDPPAGGLPGASVHPDDRGRCPLISYFWGFIYFY